jgi:choline-glycine betaine transporter
LGALLKRFWADHRLATVISLALLFLGLLIKPWTLVLVLVVAFGGPLVGRLESLAASPVSNWRRSQWMGLALLLAAVLLALTGSSGGQGALILALLPVAWVLITDRSILQGSKVDERASLREPLTLSRAADEDESSAQAEAKLDREAAAAEPPERLVGGELLAKIKELGDVGKSDLVRLWLFQSEI